MLLFLPSLLSTNKRIADEVAIIPSKRLRNKIAGFTTHLMKRIQKGPVRGISFKLQEEERERKDNYVPEVSAIAVPETGLEIDPDTKVRSKLLSCLSLDLGRSTTMKMKKKARCLEQKAKRFCLLGLLSSLAYFPPSQDLLRSLNMDNIPVNVSAPILAYTAPERGPRGAGRGGRNVPGAGRS